MRTIDRIKALLFKALDMIDSGDCDDITNDELDQISAIIHRPENLGREAAAKYLGISLNRFHELRDLGIIPMPIKVKGQKEKLYSVCELKKCIIQK